MASLSVPYFTQPDASHCQATCLKMMAEYLDGVLGQPRQGRSITAIKQSINSDAGRPVIALNHWDNFIWWLEREFSPDVEFAKDVTTDEAAAAALIKASIQNRSPVLVSTTHALTSGHIVLVVGVWARSPHGAIVEPAANASDEENVFEIHDPYGAFDPALYDPRHADRRFEGGVSAGGEERGPGRSLLVGIHAIRRGPDAPNSQNAFLLIRATRITRA